MEIPDDDVRAFLKTGADTLTFNSPLGMRRASALVDRLAEFSPDSVVDLGCGRGNLARAIAVALPNATVVGVDTDTQAIEQAQARAVADRLDHRLRFETADAALWPGPADATICVGASHAFGGTAGMLQRLSHIVPQGIAAIGEGVWNQDPDPWCLETFGHLPAGPDALVAEAVSAGWSILEQGMSTLAEWDAFEHGWIAGVRSIGTESATAFARQREHEYQRYRNVLGFCWLVLRR